MIQILVNLNGTPLKNNFLEEYKLKNNNFYVFSSYKGDEALNCVEKWTFVPCSYNFSWSANNAFWIINFFIDNNYINPENEIIFINPFDRNIKFKISDLRLPIIDHYFGNVNRRFKDMDAYSLWKNRNDPSYLNKILENNYSNIEEKFKKQLIQRVQKLKNKYCYPVINGGNEGVLLQKDKNKIIKRINVSVSVIDKKIKDIAKKIKNEENDIILPDNALELINKFYNFEIIYSDKGKYIEFEYPNKFLPTININYAFQAQSLIKQNAIKILIDDNKKENYAKYKIDNTKQLFKTVFNDYGGSFIQYKDEEEREKMFFGIIRDNYYFVKYFHDFNAREKIKDKRKFDSLEKIKDKKFFSFYKFVLNAYKDIGLKRACLLSELPTSGNWVFCKDKTNTMTRIWDEEENIYLDLTCIDEDKVINCNCANLLKSLPSNKNKKIFCELDLNLNYACTSYEVNFDPKYIALLTTKGERKLDVALKSIEVQSSSVDAVFIASEQNIQVTKYTVLVNPYEKGLARNTMQALVRIKQLYANDDVYVCTIDDDDEWKTNYIKKVKEKVSLGANFVSCDLVVQKNNKQIDIFKYLENEINVEAFLYGNPGIQGSNKVFNLNIALESGGMPQHINAATDRAFNINLLLHPEIKFAKLSSAEVIFNQNDDPKRITNQKNRLEELRKFYKHFWHLIDKDKIHLINERHKQLHGLNEVINWK